MVPIYGYTSYVCYIYVYMYMHLYNIRHASIIVSTGEVQTTNDIVQIFNCLIIINRVLNEP